MSPATEKLVLKELTAIRVAADRFSDDMLEVKKHIGALEHHYAAISTSLDRLDDRFLRIEKHIELVEI